MLSNDNKPSESKAKQNKTKQSKSLQFFVKVSASNQMKCDHNRGAKRKAKHRINEKCTKVSDSIRLNVDSNLNRIDEIDLQYEKHD
jgi:biopolymer transport protein ExbD